MPEIPLNYLAIVAAALAHMVVGMLWYGPLFGRQWKAYMGLTDGSMKSMPLTAMQAVAGGAVMALLMAYVLAHLLVFVSAFFKISGVMAGLQVGFWNWLGFAVPLTAGSFLWEGKPWKLWILNASQYLVSLLAMGVILAVWQ